MPIAETILATVTKSVFSFVLQQANVSDHMRRLLAREPKQLAFRRALGKALEQLEREHPEWTSALFDASFFENEGAPVLAQFMIRDGRPDPSELAARWADSLNMHQTEQRTTRTRELEPVAADFLDDLARALKAEPELNDLNDSRALEQLAGDLQAIRHKLGADQATPGTRRDYLCWLVGRNLYLDPRGTFQTQRQVQVKLEDIYVSLRAQREETAGVSDQRILEQELAKIEVEVARRGLSAEEVEDRREQILARLKGRDPKARGEVLELAEAVNRHERLVILGDPGTGKSTLLRYLALKHAQALQDGRAEAGSGLGQALFPILIRIADYAENEVWKEKSLTDFLAEACIVQECPRTGIADLLMSELSGGNCLVLLDGLDEIVSADDRQGVVRRIEDFVRRHDNRVNRFVVTSRIAGYSSAPLSGAFTHYTVQEMDEPQIRRFLELWCLAVEVVEMPESPPEEHERKAQQEIDSILKAVQTNPGVRRLAANPLLLRTLALIHRTGAQLPQKRIELYKLAADTLGRTWRIASGVPESELVQDEYLTRVLRKLAYWLHETKNTGIATEREVYDVLIREWARIKRLDRDPAWDPDEPDPEVVEEVKRFLRKVQVHTGLFVERSPRRYGFMHLTFEEYYAARNLVAVPRKCSKLIREHLHDPRWDEPILLALGFVGLDYPDQAIELLETAILAQSEEAEELGFTPSPYEDILRRDYLFALRCLGDQIPADPILVKQLMQRLADELLHGTGSAKFQRYRQALERRLEYLQGSSAVTDLVAALIDGLSNDDPYVRLRAAYSLGQFWQATPEVSQALITALADDEGNVRHQAAQSLDRLGQVAPEVMQKLITALADDDADIRLQAAQSLGQLGQATPEVVQALITALADDHADVRSQAVQSLGQLGQGNPEVAQALITALADDHADVRSQAARSLGQLGQATPEVAQALIAALANDQIVVRYQAAQSLGQLGQGNPEVAQALIAALANDQIVVGYQAARSLGQLGQGNPEVAQALITALADDHVRSQAAWSLGQLGQGNPEVAQALVAALADKTHVRSHAVQILSQFWRATPEVIQALITALADDKAGVRSQAAQILGQLGQATPEVIQALLAALADDKAHVRSQVAQSLGQLGQVSPKVAQVLIAALADDKAGVRSQAAQILGQLGQATPEVAQALIAAFADDDANVQYRAALSLGRLGQLTPEVVEILLDGVRYAEDWSVRGGCAELLGQISRYDREAANVLLTGLTDQDIEVRTACTQALVKLGRRNPEAMEEIANILIQALDDPKFDPVDSYENRTGHDYAFDGLWMLVVGEQA